MNKVQLKQEYPGLIAEIEDEKHEAGVQNERARVKRLMKAAESDPENAKLEEVVDAAIQSGEHYEDVAEKVTVAIRDGKKLAGENPPSVGTEPTGEALSAEERKLIENLGITEEDYRNSKKEAE